MRKSCFNFTIYPDVRRTEFVVVARTHDDRFAELKLSVSRGVYCEISGHNAG
ncbi:hypothetical protein WN55_01225 [Dufourea novaeangliae]|uniref:Uncharacterized protein n=1 Tax=Dufourea novaeangliae TaxID=178035 RepID=A0A154NW98_DUFNO|nr:hypothetical protein WN55_01225 [Dufourea novaeangliae]